jgi:carboxylesterase
MTNSSNDRLAPPKGWLEDFAADGSGANSKTGIVLVHGFTGSPASMRPWAHFLNDRGYTVRVPRLPGHGTKWQDLNEVKWQEWPDRASIDVEELLQKCDRVFVFALSMGGATSIQVAQRFGKRIAGLVFVNPMIIIKGPAIKFAPLVAMLTPKMKAVGGDIKRPGVSEWSYNALPTKGVLQLNKLLKDSRAKLPEIKVPFMIFHSKDDHVLPVYNTDIYMAEIGSVQKQRIELTNSYHVATIDYDQDIIFENSLQMLA